MLSTAEYLELKRRYENTIEELIKERDKEWEKRFDLEETITRAIEYIKGFDYYIPEDNIPRLLNILEGKENIE